MFPIFYALGPLSISTFGVFLCLSFITGTFLTFRAFKDRIDTKLDDMFDALLLLSLGALIGARIIFVLLHPSEFSGNILEYILVRERPGLSFIGAVAGAGVVFALLSRTSKIPWGKVIDHLVGPLSVSLLLGQIGSLLDGFSFGGPTKLPWGVSIFGEAVKRNPLPLYYIILLLPLLIFLPKIERFGKERKWAPGSIFFLFVGAYSLLSLIINIWKEEKQIVYMGISLEQIIASILFVVATVNIIILNGGFKQLNRKKP